jgi:hypothetical protein
VVPAPTDAPALPDRIDLRQFLSTPNIELTDLEKRDVSALLVGNRILGPAASAVMLCPGNFQSVRDIENRNKCCPYVMRCPYLKAGKAPEKELCPVEIDHVAERFQAWAEELSDGVLSLTETERVAVSDLTWIDLQMQRSNAILAVGEAARLTDLSVKDTNDKDKPVSWEKIIHANQVILTTLAAQRDRVFDNWELTPRAKTRRTRVLGKQSGNDASTRQSERADKLRKVMGLE